MNTLGCIRKPALSFAVITLKSQHHSVFENHAAAGPQLQDT
jgi:hypothetical protein